MKLFVTGAAGFIGSNYVRWLLAHSDDQVTIFDALTYAGNLGNLASLAGDARHAFVRGDIGEAALVTALTSWASPSKRATARPIIGSSSTTSTRRLAPLGAGGPRAGRSTITVGSTTRNVEPCSKNRRWCCAARSRWRSNAPSRPACATLNAASA